MNGNSKKTIISSIVFSLLVLISSCADNGFNGTGDNKKNRNTTGKNGANGNGIDGNGNTTAGGGPGTGNAQETIDVATTQKKLDLVWVIDNSRSMTDNIAQVVANFSSYLASISNRTDVKLALISRSSGSNAVAIGGKVDVRVDVEVRSNNPLELLAVSICAPATSKGFTGAGSSFIGDPNKSGTSTICGTTVTSSYTPQTDVPTAAGRLNGFFRADAKPSFVFVTDDDAYGVTSGNFMQLVQPLMNQKPTLFGFVGKTKTGRCKITRAGTSYETLAINTGGQTFDICTPDWSANFNTLSASMTNMVANHFPLKTLGVKSITKVTVDGAVIPAGQYKLSGNAIEFVAGTVQPTAKSIVVDLVH